METKDIESFYDKVRAYHYYLSFTNEEADKLLATKNTYSMTHPTNKILGKSTSIQSFKEQFEKMSAKERLSGMKQIFASGMHPDLLRTLCKQDPLLCAQYLVNTIFPDAYPPGLDSQLEPINMGKDEPEQPGAKLGRNERAKTEAQKMERHLLTLKNLCAKMHYAYVVSESLLRKCSNMIEEDQSAAIPDLLEDIRALDAFTITPEEFSKHLEVPFEKTSLIRKRIAMFQPKKVAAPVTRTSDIGMKESYEKGMRKIKRENEEIRASTHELREAIKRQESALHMATTKEEALKREIQELQTSIMNYTQEIRQKDTTIAEMAKKREAPPALVKERFFDPDVDVLERSKIGVSAYPYHTKTDSEERKKVKQRIIRKVQLLLPPEERADKDLVRMARYQLLTSMTNSLAMTLQLSNNHGNLLAVIENEFF